MLLQQLPESSFEVAGAVHGRGRGLQCSGEPLRPAADEAASAGSSDELPPVLEKACRLPCTASMSSARLPKST